MTIVYHVLVQKPQYYVRRFFVYYGCKGTRDAITCLCRGTYSVLVYYIQIHAIHTSVKFHHVNGNSFLCNSIKNYLILSWNFEKSSWEFGLLEMLRTLSFVHR